MRRSRWLMALPTFAIAADYHREITFYEILTLTATRHLNIYDLH